MIIEYRQLTNLSRRYEAFLTKHEGNYKPSIGEVVNIDGEPYVVFEVGAAIGEGGEYLYITVIRINTKTVREEEND